MAIKKKAKRNTAKATSSGNLGDITANVSIKREVTPASVGPPPAPPDPAYPMPGLELLGRGIYLKPRQPYELKQRLVGPNPAELVGPPKPAGAGGLAPLPNAREIYCVDAGKSYLVSNEFEVNHSPPMPANQTLNQTVIEHSWESLESHFEVSANVAAGVGAFSLKANYSQINQLRSSEEASYELRTSFIPAWTVDYTRQPDVSPLLELLKKLNDEIQRRLWIGTYGKDGKWMYELESLLSKQTPVADTDLSEIQTRVGKLQSIEKSKRPPDSAKAENLPALRDWLEHFKRSKFVELFAGEEYAYLEKLLSQSEPIEELTKPELAKLRSEIAKLLPKPLVEKLPDPLTANNLAAQCALWFAECEKKDGWMYDLKKLLFQSEPIDVLTNPELAKLRWEIAELLPEHLKEILPKPLTANNLAAQRALWFPEDEKAEGQSQFDRTRRDLYEEFFQKYGTHFVKRVWVGGAATLAFVNTKSSSASSKGIGAGVSASQGGVSGGVATNQANSLAARNENSTCSVWGKGGDESALAGLNTLDQASYNRWLESVKANPQVIELEVVGIWSLLRDEHTNELTREAGYLRDAYRRIYEFEPLAALFSPDPQSVYFIKSTPPQKVDYYSTFEKKMSRTWTGIKVCWPGLEYIGFDRIDAAFSGTSLRSRSPMNLEGYGLKLFKDEIAYGTVNLWKYGLGGERKTRTLSMEKLGDGVNWELLNSVIIVNVADCLHFRIADTHSNLVAVESEASIRSRHTESSTRCEQDRRLKELKEKLKQCWDDETERDRRRAEIIEDVWFLLDRSFALDRKLFLFRRDQYIWLDYSTLSVPADIDPRPVSVGWPGVPFDCIDAAFNAGPASIYFFSGDEYVRFNWTKNKADFKPKKFRAGWTGVTFDRIDAAIYWGSGKVYFFRGDRYIAYDMLTCRADPGYPKFLPGSYVEDWKIFD